LSLASIAYSQPGSDPAVASSSASSHTRREKQQLRMPNESTERRPPNDGPEMKYSATPGPTKVDNRRASGSGSLNRKSVGSSSGVSSSSVRNSFFAFDKYGNQIILTPPNQMTKPDPDPMPVQSRHNSVIKNEASALKDSPWAPDIDIKGPAPLEIASGDKGSIRRFQYINDGNGYPNKS
jgi:hypothetical protein